MNEEVIIRPYHPKQDEEAGSGLALVLEVRSELGSSCGWTCGKCPGLGFVNF